MRMPFRRSGTVNRECHRRTAVLARACRSSGVQRPAPRADRARRALAKVRHCLLYHRSPDPHAAHEPPREVHLAVLFCESYGADTCATRIISAQKGNRLGRLLHAELTFAHQPTH
jgi:hypothetical protein